MPYSTQYRGARNRHGPGLGSETARTLTSNPLFQTVRVLVVEDSEFHASLMMRMLGIMGVGDAVLAENGTEALM